MMLKESVSLRGHVSVMLTQLAYTLLGQRFDGDP
jgi:hypothetical protein